MRRFREDSVLVSQLLIAAALDDRSAIKDKDPIGILERGETMGHQDDGVIRSGSVDGR